MRLTTAAPALPAVEGIRAALGLHSQKQLKPVCNTKNIPSSNIRAEQTEAQLSQAVANEVSRAEDKELLLQAALSGSVAQNYNWSNTEIQALNQERSPALAKL